MLGCPFAEECRQCLRAGVSLSAGVQDGSAVARGARKQGISSDSISKIVSLLPNVPAVINRLSQPAASESRSTSQPSWTDIENVMKTPTSTILKPSSSGMLIDHSRGSFFNGCGSRSQSMNAVLAIILHVIAEVNLLQVRELNE